MTIQVLGFRHVLPVVGRVVNLEKLKAVADEELQDTFFRSPAGNLCFTSKCSYYCDSG